MINLTFYQNVKEKVEFNYKNVQQKKNLKKKIK